MQRIQVHHTNIARYTKRTALRRGRKIEREKNTGTKGVKWQKYLPVITSNVDRLNAPIKRHRVAE